MKPTQEQVIAWAREVGMQLDPKDSFADEMYLAVLKRAFTLAYEAGRKDENEACAEVCDEQDHDGVMIAKDCADAIRARREQ